MSEPIDQSAPKPPAPEAQGAERRRAREREEGGGSRSAPLSASLGRKGLRLASQLGFKSLYRFGGTAGRLLAKFPSEERRATRINLELCLPELDLAARRELERASLVETGRTMLELGAMWCWPRERVLGLVRETVGLELFRAALAAGRGVLMMTPHLGAWELTGLYVSSMAPITAMYKPPRVREMESFYKDARERLGAKLVPADASGVRALHRALRNGEVAGVLPDQDPGKGSGIFSPFFGVLANTTTLIPKLANRSGARVLLIWAERLPRAAGFRIHFVEPDAPELCGDDVELGVRAMNRAIESLIRSAPKQYLWSYKRFRYRPSGLKNPYRHGLNEQTVGVRAS